MATRICKGSKCPLYGKNCQYKREIPAPEGFSGKTYTLCNKRK